MRELKVGDNIWLRDDLEDGVKYGKTYWTKLMHRGSLEKVFLVYLDAEGFEIEGGDSWDYTSEMIDWDKTHEMWEELKKSSPIYQAEEFAKHHLEGLALAVKSWDNDKKKMIVMPKFFDEWYTQFKGLSDGELVLRLSKKHLDGGLSDEFEKCYRAILDGYEVEKEQLYTVNIENSVVGLVKNNHGYIVFVEDYDDWCENQCQLTQKEIEDYDKRYMTFAKKVDM